MATNRAKIVELIGPSGSGKSTFVEHVLAKNRGFDTIETAAFRGLVYHPSISIPCATLFRLLPIGLARRLRLTKIVTFYRDQIIRVFGMSYRNLLNHVHTSIDKLSIPIEEKFWLSDRVFEAVINHHLIMQPINNGRKILADEFFLQKIFSLGLENEHVSIFLQNLDYKIDVVLKFNEKAQVCLSRLRLRDSNRNPGIRDMSDTDVLQNIKDAQATADLTASILKDNGVSIIEIDGNVKEKEVINIIEKI